ncbi:hypothetical protein Ndes2526B_g00863 [Nannochloris sp. 'desiccata']
MKAIQSLITRKVKKGPARAIPCCIYTSFYVNHTLYISNSKMQSASLVVRAPLVALAAKPSARRPAARSSLVVSATLNKDGPTFQRRSLAALLAAVPAFLPASRALADLIPDDDDEELVEKARANRKNRLASEKQTQKAFSRSEGFVDGAEKRNLVPIQRAINSLGLTGKQLSGGDVASAASTLSDSWFAEFPSAVDALSADAAAKTSAGQVVAKLGDLKAATLSGSLGDAKKEYVAVVGSLESWASAAGLSGTIKGL